LSNQEAKINNDFDRLKSNVDNKSAILKANQAIEDLQNGVGGATGLNKYSDGLSKLQFREDEINKKYEERAKALTKIATINQRISEQTKGQLSLAQALSSGDISAAAQAAFTGSGATLGNTAVPLVVGGMGLADIKAQEDYLNQQQASGAIDNTEYNTQMARINEAKAKATEAVNANPYQFGDTTAGSGGSTAAINQNPYQFAIGGSVMDGEACGD